MQNDDNFNSNTFIANALDETEKDLLIHRKFIDNFTFAHANFK
jgi:hypothetical protein